MRNRFIIIGIMLLIGGLLLIVVPRCAEPEAEPTPTLPVSATPSDTPAPPTATSTSVPATATPAPSMTPFPATAVPQPTDTATAVAPSPTATIVVTQTPQPTATPRSYVVRHPIEDTLWNRAALDCGDANLWPVLAAANGVKNPRWLRAGDVIILECVP